MSRRRHSPLQCFCTATAARTLLLVFTKQLLSNPNTNEARISAISYAMSLVWCIKWPYSDGIMHIASIREVSTAACRISRNLPVSIRYYALFGISPFEDLDETLASALCRVPVLFSCNLREYTFIGCPLLHCFTSEYVYRDACFHVIAIYTCMSCDDASKLQARERMAVRLLRYVQ